MYERRTKDLSSAILEAGSFQEAVQRLDALEINRGFLDDLSSLLFESIETSEALGRSLIARKDVYYSQGDRTQTAKVTLVRGWLSSSEVSWFLCDDKVVHISFDLIPEEVLQLIRYKAITIAGVEDAELVEAVKQKLLDAVERGADFGDFKAQVNSIFDSYGITRASSNHLQTVFRTNIFSSFSMAQLNQVEAMKDRFPMWRYVAILDDRTRPSHRQLNGRLFEVGKGPIPPIDYNCRCTAQYLHISEVESGGFSPTTWKDPEHVVKLDIRDSFEDWAAGKREDWGSGLQKWADEQL